MFTYSSLSPSLYCLLASSLHVQCSKARRHQMCQPIAVVAAVALPGDAREHRHHRVSGAKRRVLSI